MKNKKCIFCKTKLKEGELVHCPKCTLILFDARRSAIIDIANAFSKIGNTLMGVVNFLDERMVNINESISSNKRKPRNKK